MSRQQYQRLESKGNPRLDTLELIAKGLKSEFLLIPQEKLNAVMAVLANDDSISSIQTPTHDGSIDKQKALSDDPWQGLLGDEA